MTDEDRKFLTEQMQECWHLLYSGDEMAVVPCCSKCGRRWSRIKNRTFDNWSDFGAVWEWARKQRWLWEFHLWAVFNRLPEDLKGGIEAIAYLIDPIRFPQLICDWLREREKEERK